MKLRIVGQYKTMAKQYGCNGYCTAKNKYNYEG